MCVKCASKTIFLSLKISKSLVFQGFSGLWVSLQIFFFLERAKIFFLSPSSFLPFFFFKNEKGNGKENGFSPSPKKGKKERKGKEKTKEKCAVKPLFSSTTSSWERRRGEKKKDLAFDSKIRIFTIFSFSYPREGRIRKFTLLGLKHFCRNIV